jgi:hypothetical protein
VNAETPHGNPLHLYTRRHQPATRFVVTLDVRRGPADAPRIVTERKVFTLRPRACVWAWCCQRRRVAANCTTQVYYDSQPYWCAEGRGCQTKTRPPRRVTARRLMREFQSGLSFVGLARKYGLTSRRVQDRVRGYLKRQATAA